MFSWVWNDWSHDWMTDKNAEVACTSLVTNTLFFEWMSEYINLDWHVRADSSWNTILPKSVNVWVDFAKIFPFDFFNWLTFLVKMEFDFLANTLIFGIDSSILETIVLYVLHVEITKTTKFMLRKPVIVRERVRPSRIYLNIDWEESPNWTKIQTYKRFLKL